MTWTDKLDHKTKLVCSSDAVCGAFRLCIHHYTGCGDTWFFSVVHGPFNKVDLKAKTLADAKQEAGQIFRACLDEATLALEE